MASTDVITGGGRLRALFSEFIKHDLPTAWIGFSNRKMREGHIARREARPISKPSSCEERQSPGIILFFKETLS